MVRSRPRRTRALIRRKSARVKYARSLFSYPVLKVPGVHNFKRTVWDNISVYNWATLQNTARYFTLSELPNATEITTLFDQYRIMAIKGKFMYNHNSSEQPSAAEVATLPNLGHVIDYDDATPLITREDYLQYEGFKLHRMDKPFTVYFKPRVSGAVYAGGAFTGYAEAKRNLWIDNVSSNAQYYGFKYFMDPVITGTGTLKLGTLHIYWTFYFQCKNVR